MLTLSRREPAIVSSILLTLGVGLMVLGVVLMDARETLMTPEGLASRAGAALADPRVSAYVADRATNALLAAQPDLTAFRPVVAAAAAGTVSSQPFQRAIQVSIRSTMAAVLAEGSSKIALSLPDLGVLLRSALTQANPALAEKIPSRVRGAISILEEGRVARAVIDTVRWSRRLVRFVAILFALGAVCLAAGFALARDRRRALLDVSVHLITAGVFLLVLRAAGGWFLQSGSGDALGREALAGVWTAFTSGIRGWALTLSFVGLVMAASARSFLDRISVGELIARAWHAVQEPPGGTWGRLGRSVVLIALGGAAVVYPREVVEWLTLAAGGTLTFLGVREAFALLQAWGAPAERSAATPAGGKGVRRVAAVGAATALLALAAIALMRPAPAAVALTAGVCNGSAVLCERPLDRVTFPGAHNAMSAADVAGWMFPQHERGVASQLTDGIRAFLIDVHYGRPAASAVVTDLDAETASRAKIEEAVGPEGVEAALRIRGRFAGGDLGPRGLYLCHGFCELGAQPLGPWLRTVADFLVQHPDEVVLIVVEDYVAPEDLAAEFDRAGLADLAYRGTGRTPWPTLRTLIDTRQRVVVMTESGRAGVPWLLPAFDVMQETPYKFRNPSEMSCAVNRGGTTGSLFQINNWIDTTPAPKPSNAAMVNAHDALLARAQRCREERGLMPTILAVDFYRTGDVVGVARALNR